MFLNRLNRKKKLQTTAIALFFVTLAWLAVFSKAEKAPRRRLMAFDNFRHAAQCRWVCWTKRLLDCWTVSKRLVQSTGRNPPQFPLYLLRSWVFFFLRGGKDPPCYSPESQWCCPKIIGLIRLIFLFQWSFLGSLGTAGNMKIIFFTSSALWLKNAWGRKHSEPNLKSQICTCKRWRNM